MIYNRTQQVIPLLMVGAAWYLIITTVLSLLQHSVERSLARSVTREAPPSRWRQWRNRYSTPAVIEERTHVRSH